MHVSECTPFVRAAQIQPAVLEGATPRIAYDYRIFLILDGRGTIRMNGKDYALAPDSLLCFPLGTEYYFRGKMKVAVLNFDVTRACQNQRKPLMPVPREEYDEASRFDLTLLEGYEAPLLIKADAIKCEYVTSIVSAFCDKSPYSDARTSALVKLLLAEILEDLSCVRDPRSRLVDKILLYIRSNAAEIESNDALGKALGYHPIYIASLVKEKTGKSLHQTILEERVRLACKWLVSTDNSVEQIAFDTGFSSRNHFCTVFRRVMGMTPLAYRSSSPQSIESKIL